MNDDPTELDEKSRAFEIRYTKESVRITPETEESVLQKIRAPELDDVSQLFVYCELFTYYRRRKDVRKCFSIFEEYKKDFEDTFSFNHLYSIAIKQSGKLRDICTSIRYARKSLKAAPHHAGALHNLAESLLLRYASEQVDSESHQEWLNEAMDCVDEAIALEPDYAKFYATKSRILSRQNLPGRAKDSIGRAIELEDSSLSDYSIRLTDYLAIKSEIELNEQVARIEKTAAIKLSEAMDETRRSNFEILSFFVAAVSFVIAGINISISFQPKQVVGLIFVLSSALLMSVGGFSLAYSSNRDIGRLTSIALLSGLMLAIGYGLSTVWE